MPVVLVTCVKATTFVRGVIILSNPAIRSSLLAAGIFTGTLLTTRPSRRARIFQESLFEGWL